MLPPMIHFVKTIFNNRYTQNSATKLGDIETPKVSTNCSPRKIRPQWEIVVENWEAAVPMCNAVFIFISTIIARGSHSMKTNAAGNEIVEL